MKRFFILVFIIHLGFQSASGAEANYAADFLDLGIGARPLAMGGAYVSLSNDATGFYWNPAGIAFLPRFQAASMYADLFNNLQTQSYVSAAMPLFGGGALSVGWIRLSIDDIPRYIFEEDPNVNAFQRISDPELALTDEPVGFFGSYEDAFFLTFAKYVPLNIDLGWQYFELPVDVGLGMNVKMIRQSLDDKSGSGIGLDGGIIVKMGLNELFADDIYGDLALGLNLQDVTNTQITWDTMSKRKDYVGRNFKYGLSYTQPLHFIDSKMTLVYDLNSQYEGSTHLGGEFVIKSLLALRLGMNSGNFTTGAGVNMWKLSLDYAYQSHDLGNAHRVSIIFKL